MSHPVSNRFQPFLDFVSQNRIKVIAWDFDQTWTTSHSGGVLEKQQVSKFTLSADAIQLCLGLEESKWNGQHVVVSFADVKLKTNPTPTMIGGKELVSTLFEHRFPFSRPKFEYFCFYPFGDKKPTKEKHLEQVCARFQVTPTEVLLIDDTFANVLYAKEKGYRAWWVKEAKGFELETLVMFS
jgi:hypothetical protein